MTDFDASLLTLQLAFLAIPGSLTLFLSKRLFRLQPRSNVEALFLVFLFSVLSYGLVDLKEIGQGALQTDDHTEAVDSRETSPNDSGAHVRAASAQPILVRMLEDPPSVSHSEVLSAVIASVLLSLLLSYGDTYKLVNKVGMLLRATRRYGDEDVWHYFLNAPDSEKNDGWVLVRDHEQDLAFYGAITIWSDSGHLREMVLSTVDVHSNATGNLLYSVDTLYLCRSDTQLTIEVPRPLAEVEGESHVEER